MSDDSLTDDEADELLCSLAVRLHEAREMNAKTVTAPRHEVMLALGLAAKFRELAAAAPTCQAFELNGNVFVRRQDA